MKCNKCGNLLPEDSKFCQYCGNKIIAAEDKPEKNASESNSEITEDKIMPAVIPVTDVKEDTNTVGDISSKNKKIKYCKSCGGKIDPTTKKCTSCGRQYFHIGNTAKIVLVSLLVVVLVSLNFIQFFSSRNTIEDLNAIIEQKEAELVSKDKTIKSKTSSINKLKKKADRYDSICSNLRGSNIGYAASHFNSNKSLIVVPYWKTESFTLTATWYNGGSIYIDYDGDSAEVRPDNNSWGYSTSVTVMPKHVGPTIVTFSNGVDNEKFKILIIVTE